MKKVFVLKSIIRKMLKELKINEELSLKYSKDKEAKIKKLTDKTFEIDTENMPLSNLAPRELKNTKQKIELKYSDLIEFIDFKSAFYLFLTEEELLNLNKKHNQEINKSKKLVERKEQEKNHIEKGKEEYQKVLEILKNLHRKIVDKTFKIKDEYIEKNNIKTQDKEKTHYLLNKLWNYKYQDIWNVISESLNELQIKNTLGYKSIKIEIGDEKYSMYTSVIVDEFNNEVPFNKNVKKYNQMLNQNNDKIYENSKNKFVTFEKITNVIEYTEFSKLNETGTKFSQPNVYITSKLGYDFNLFDKMFSLINKDIIKKYNLDLSKNNILKYDDNTLKKDRVIFVVNNDFKPVVKIIKETLKTTIGEYYCIASNQYVKAEWNKETGKCIIGSKWDLIKYPFRKFTMENFDWGILPKNTNMLFRRRDEDVWDSSDQFPLEFNTIKGNYSNTIMQNFNLNISKKYNFTITNCSNDLKLYKKEFQKANLEALTREISGTICNCGCGSKDTKAMYWNGNFQGFKCPKSYENFAYSNTMSFG